MQVLDIYEQDIQTISVNSAFVGCSSNDEQTSFVLKHGSVSIVLSTDTSPHVGTGDIVANSWVLSFLNVKSSGQVQVEPLVVDKIDTPCEVELIFEAYQSQIGWEDVPHTGPINIPFVWSRIWPEGIKANALERNASSLLAGSILLDGALICMRVLDSLMVYRVRLSGLPDHIQPRAVRTSRQCTFHIVQARSIPAHPASIQPTPAQSTTIAPLCFAPTVHNVLHLCEGLLGPQARPRGFVKSALLSAPAGGGKSTVLRTVATMCERRYDGAVVLRASCKSIDQGQDGADVSTSTQSDSEWSSSLLQVLRLLGIEYPHNKRQSISTDHILLCLDDIDVIFAHYSSRKDDNIEHSRNSDLYLQLGFHLSRLLHALSSPSCDANVLVVGCTRRDTTELLRAHTGCPEFERCFALLSPTHAERTLILETLLADAKLILQAPVDDTPAVAGSALTAETHVQAPSAGPVVQHQWAVRLAGLSAGYLPGDLAAVVQRVVFLHRGKVAARQRHSLRPSTTAEVPTAESENVNFDGDAVPWTTALEAVVSVVPLTLQQLGVQGGGAKQSNSSGGASARLSWSDFAGYTDLVIDLKRRLAPRPAPGPAPPTAVVTESQGNGANGANGAVKTLRGAALRGIVLHGPSGCGKTLLASVITSELKMNFVSVRSTDLLSRYFGETESKIRDLFQRARAAAPCVLFFDDFDTLAHKRSAADAGDGSTSNGLHGRILSTFLNELDGIISGPRDSSDSGASGGRDEGSQQVLVIAACQDVASLDEALVRPGRLQHHVLLHQPSSADITAILTLYASKLRRAPDLSLTQAGEVLCANMASASEVECFVRNAFMHAIRERVAQIESAGVGGCVRDGVPHTVQQRHFDLALQDLLGGRADGAESVADSIVNDAATVTISGVADTPSFEWSGGFSFGV